MQGTYRHVLANPGVIIKQFSLCSPSNITAARINLTQKSYAYGGGSGFGATADKAVFTVVHQLSNSDRQ